METLLASLISGVGVAIVAAGFALFGARVQRLREHEKWVREKRFEAYVEFAKVARAIAWEKHALAGLEAQAKKCVAEINVLEAAVATAESSDDAERIRARVKKLTIDVEYLERRMAKEVAEGRELSRTLIERTAPFILLGPLAVIAAVPGLTDEDAATSSAAVVSIETAMRSALNVSF